MSFESSWYALSLGIWRWADFWSVNGCLHQWKWDCWGPMSRRLLRILRTFVWYDNIVRLWRELILSRALCMNVSIPSWIDLYCTYYILSDPFFSWNWSQTMSDHDLTITQWILMQYLNPIHESKAGTVIFAAVCRVAWRSYSLKTSARRKMILIKHGKKVQVDKYSSDLLKNWICLERLVRTLCSRKYWLIVLLVVEIEVLLCFLG